jgi:methionine synthase II (cobalamin-independent)
VRFSMKFGKWTNNVIYSYVCPPIVVSDVSRPNPMTVKWSSYAQSIRHAVAASNGLDPYS